MDGRCDASGIATVQVLRDADCKDAPFGGPGAPTS